MDKDRQLEILHRLKQSQVLGRFFVGQRELMFGPNEILPEIEKLQLEWLLSRYIARNQKNFVRADAYRLLLFSLNVPVDEIDLELHPPRDPGLRRRL